MSAREEFETWLKKWDVGHAVALPTKLDALEREATEKALRDAAVTVRAQAPKYLDNEVDQAIFYALDRAAGLIDPGKQEMPGDDSIWDPGMGTP